MRSVEVGSRPAAHHTRTTRNAKAIFDEARDRFLRDSQGKLASEKPISLDGFSGREVKLNTHGGQTIARFYLAEDRFYQLAIIAIDPKEKSTNETDAFFSSFRIIARPK